MTTQEKPIEFTKTQVTTPCSFCEKCGQDLFACDSCDKDFLDCEDIYCAEKENFHICEKCMNKKQKQQLKENKQKKQKEDGVVNIKHENSISKYISTHFIKIKKNNKQND